ncbi:TetR/AcrR family transcriptional regulator [Nocardioides panzhihuensis]|uniref:AcrR family transcriptional regulator n=1 Tax=Nocardioides panzhihuensis TaxID=860243 RepID=A0A7Z0DR48_9ACTN|nr:TetR/AcrR family transcriptional regulator [Nocardioides panzhihuensis]NYI80275.1 AcrR family transcriptional regulator [Nocardioides panzhihuensis]
MTSERNNATEASTADRLLTAARACVLDVGWKRTTLTDVANRAGVSRMTVYRTYVDMDSLFGDLMTREWAEVVASVVATDDRDASWPDRIATGVAGSVAALREDALLRRMVDVDPEWLLRYLLHRRGRSQDAVLDMLAEQITRGQSEGSLRAGDPVLLARSIVLTAHGFLFSSHTMTDETVTHAGLDHELAELVRRFLTP